MTGDARDCDARYDVRMQPVETETESIPYVSGYLRLVSEDDIVAAMRAQTEVTLALFRGIGEERSGFRYAEGKWSIREVVGHLADGERVFGYRAMCVARGEQQSLPGFDENEYQRLSDYDRWSLEDSLAQWELLRRANLLMFSHLTPEAWKREGTANGTPVTPDRIARVIVGHERHHLGILRERYDL